MSPNNSDLLFETVFACESCYSKLVLHVKVYFILSCLSSFNKQATFSGLYHGKGYDIITNFKIMQKLFPSNSLSDLLQIILHLYVTPIFVLEDFSEIPSGIGLLVHWGSRIPSPQDF